MSNLSESNPSIVAFMKEQEKVDQRLDDLNAEISRERERLAKKHEHVIVLESEIEITEAEASEIGESISILMTGRRKRVVVAS